MRPLLVLALVVGCYKPAYEDCDITCAGNACPAGLTCVAGVCRLSGATGTCSVLPNDGGPDDPDGDGVMNADDNCPQKSNADQANEDRDAFGDVCDPCPPVGGVGNDDGDGDTVGDACDPDPGKSGHRIEMFDGLNGMMPTATHVGGTFTLAGGQATLTGSANQPSYLMWRRPPGGSTMVRAATKVSILPDPGSYGVVEQIDSSSDRGLGCVLGYDTISEITMMLVDIPQGAILAGQPAAAQPPDWQFELRTAPNSYRCSSPFLGMPAISGNSPPVPSDPHAGVWIRNGTADFYWVMIVHGP